MKSLGSRLLMVHRSSLVVLATMLASGCLGTLQPDPRAEGIALTPEAELRLPVRESQRHWLLRGESGWCGSHEVRFGGDPEDPAVATVRVVVMRNEPEATRAFARMTPAYLYKVLRGRMNNLPRPYDYPERLDGEAIAVTEYDVRLPLVISPDVALFGQLTAVRAGRVVLLIESIGVPPEQLVPAVREMNRAVYRLLDDGC